MATTFSDYVENEALDHILGTGAWTMPAAVSVALFTVNPNFETGAGGTEATGGSYARKAVAFGAASAGAAGNTAEKKWTVGTDLAAGTYTGWGVYDAAVAGNLLFGDTFAANRTVAVAGDNIAFPITTGITASLT